MSKVGKQAGPHAPEEGWVTRSVKRTRRCGEEGRRHSFSVSLGALAEEALA